ncbi:MAG: 3'-5' exonuclease [Coriobacteriales bacterium]|nr:3'-5' exonuclease [Coriobacteriales bacterium]
MDLNQALEHATTYMMPEFLYASGYDAMQTERQRNEQAIHTMREAWLESSGQPAPFDFGCTRALADRNRALCDVIGAARLQSTHSSNLSRGLKDEEIFAGVAALQGRKLKDVIRDTSGDKNQLGLAYTSAPVYATVVGVDIETTATDPDRGYIVNIGWEFLVLEKNAQPEFPHSEYCGIPDMYKESGVPLAEIHHIQWSDVENTLPFRENRGLQAELLTILTSCPMMAHNAAFEDSWFMLHLDGYAEARRQGLITIIDTKDICKSLDLEVAGMHHEEGPTKLENWARRRGVLAANENERHLGLEDVDLMLKTVLAEFDLKNLLSCEAK